MTREFHFLPDLPKANLDDRTFDDLVRECMLRIPRYCPEWTNHNPGDPGITLVELFAWMTDQMLMRFNQVPRRNYVAFLEMLGIRLQPPTAAHTDLTFFLSKEQSQPIVIPIYTEVATVRTATEPAVVFTTDRDLVIGQPQIRGLFTATQAGERGLAGQPFVEAIHMGDGTAQLDQLGEGDGLRLFADREVGNCFYLVLSPAGAPDELNEASLNHLESGTTALAPRQPADSIAGNVVALNFRGRIAETTGIDPHHPPLRWEVWDGEGWQATILRQQEDDGTKGFSFHNQRGAEFQNLDQGEGDVTLHLPQNLPLVDFGTGCWGHWIRCIYEQPQNAANVYLYSPAISRVSVRAIGGTVGATECVRLQDELLGVSHGKPGQTFQLQGYPVLARQPGEHIWMRLPNGDIETWQEVTDFGDSGATDPHYLIDSQTGTVQFGPLVREPDQLRNATHQRSQLQPWGKSTPSPDALPMHTDHSPDQKWQYGKVPPLGAEIYMSAYRMGGGSRGNVQAGTLSVMKVAIPYVKAVRNYAAATGGQEAESLDEAVLRVPQILRTSQTAVIPEDFENIARRTSAAVYRAHCPAQTDTLGLVKLLIVPKPDGVDNPQEVNFERNFPQGMAPDHCFSLEQLGDGTREQLKTAIDRHKALGIQVMFETPVYVGVKVFAEVLLQPQANTPERQPLLRNRLKAALYRFINPVTGGFDGKGWKLGQLLHASDIVALLQDLPEVSYVGAVKLFGIRKQSLHLWRCSELPDFMVDPGEWGLLCSWDDEGLASGHEIELLTQRW